MKMCGEGMKAKNEEGGKTYFPLHISSDQKWLEMDLFYSLQYMTLKRISNTKPTISKWFKYLKWSWL